MKGFDQWAGLLFPPFLLLLCFSAASADEGNDWQEETSEIETVQVTATRHKASIQDVSVAVTTVGKQEIRAEAPDVLAEMLRGLPGTYFQQTTPGQGIPIIRGLKGSQLLHLQNGMRINNALFRDAPNQYLGLVDPYAINHIEVVRGSAGSLYGADAMGGVVNFLSPEILFDGTAWQQQHNIYGSWNSVDDSLVFNARTRAGNSKHGFSGAVTWQDHSNRKTGSGNTIRPTAYRSQAADLSWTSALNENAYLDLWVQLYEQPSTPRIDELVAGFGQQHASSEQFLFKPNKRNYLHARYRTDSSASWLDSYQVNLARQVIDDDRLTQDFGSTLITTEQNKSTLDGITLQFDSSLSQTTQLIWGLEFYSDTIRSSRSEAEINTGSGELIASRFPDRSEMDSSSAYVSVDWHAGENWTLASGLRYSHFDIQLPATSSAPATALSPDDFTGDVRAIYLISPSVRLVANVGRGFRPPNIFDLGTLGNRPGNRFNTANGALKPESVHSFDLGIKTLSGNFRSEVFVFLLDYKDKITSVATGETTASGRTVVQSENLAEASIYGIEAGFRWNYTSNLEFYGSLNYTHGEEKFASSSSAADRIPPLNGQLGVVLHSSEKLQTDAYLMFAGRQDRLSERDVDDPRINPAGTAGWVSLNLLLSWKVSDKVKLGLRLENLADRSYREHGSGIDSAGRNIGAWASLDF
ncbi:MAG: hemoglobin/transferrin/lactoferrin receptor protein [Lysobacterales bacterium]|jgi:hemoglobin/transferrin/lactoferrin receptor protein